MWRILDQGREPLRENLAKLAGCSKDEIAINRNATEAINTIIFGLQLEKGDEVVVSKMDYQMGLEKSSLIKAIVMKGKWKGDLCMAKGL
jgi:selenocysteine lyase/cysteine desulfurase